MIVMGGARLKQGKLWPWLRMFAMTILGSAIFALGFDLFMVPNQINIGGVSGVAMLLTTLIGRGSVGLYSLLINVPLFLIGGHQLGKKFLFGSLAGALATSFFFDLFAGIAVPQADMMIGALYGGIISGVGIGLVFLAGASTGGSDIVAKLLRRRFRTLPLGRLMLVVDLIVISLTGIVYHDISKALYSAVPLYVTSVVMDGLIYGLDYSTVALIISDAYEPIVQAIEQKLDRGVTILDGHGGYSGAPKQVLLCAIRRKQVPQLKDLVREIDPNAFVILQEAHQVLGEGFRRHGDEM